MTDSTTDQAQAVRHALDAAQLATEAAHEAEAAIAARSEAAQTLSRVAKQTQWLSMGAAVGACLVLVGGGLFWARASTHLSQAAEVQSLASASFVENVTQMREGILEMRAVIEDAGALAEVQRQDVAALVALLDQRLEDLVNYRASNAVADSAEPPTDLLVALIEVERNLTQAIGRMACAAPATAPQAAPAATPASAAAPAATPSPARPWSAPARPAQAASRPAPQPNPFRFP